MTIKNLTPKAMRCDSGWCPSVHQLANGELLIVGRIAEPHEMAGSDIDRGDNEQAILISPALLDDVPRGWRTINSAPRGREILLTDAATADASAVAHFDTNKDGVGFWFTGDGAGYHYNAFTHWMDIPALPLPPTDREGSGE